MKETTFEKAQEMKIQIRLLEERKKLLTLMLGDKAETQDERNRSLFSKERAVKVRFEIGNWTPTLLFEPELVRQSLRNERYKVIATITNLKADFANLQD